MARILVTGGAGFIGSHMVLDLLESGHQVVVIDNLSTGHQNALLGGDFVHADLCDEKAVDTALAQYKPEAVLHFAALSEVGRSMREAELYRRSNVEATRILAKAMCRHGVRRMVFSSTASVFGAPKQQPIDEDCPLAPVNVYGETKQAAEAILTEAANQHGLEWIGLRYFNAAGADPQCRLGERHDPETHLIPLVIDAALGRLAEITIHGVDYPTEDGTCVRDYVHVVDLVAAHRAALERLFSGAGGGIFNLGSGTGHSVRSVIAAVERVSGKHIPLREGPRRAGDPPILVASSAKAQRELGWTPRFADLHDMVAHAWAFRSQRHDS